MAINARKLDKWNLGHIFKKLVFFLNYIHICIYIDYKWYTERDVCSFTKYQVIICCVTYIFAVHFDIHDSIENRIPYQICKQIYIQCKQDFLGIDNVFLFVLLLLYLGILHFSEFIYLYIIFSETQLLPNKLWFAVLLVLNVIIYKSFDLYSCNLIAVYCQNSFAYI